MDTFYEPLCIKFLLNYELHFLLTRPSFPFMPRKKRIVNTIIRLSFLFLALGSGRREINLPILKNFNRFNKSLLQLVSITMGNLNGLILRWLADLINFNIYGKQSKPWQLFNLQTHKYTKRIFLFYFILAICFNRSTSSYF